MKTAAPLMYEAVRDDSGKFILKPIGSDYDKDAERAPTALLKLKERGEWYVIQDAKGGVEAIYGVGQGANLHPDVLGYAAAGTKITKTDFPQMMKLTGLFGTGTKETIARVKGTLTEMVNAAVDQVCDFRARPTEFSIDAEVKVSVGIGGSVKLGMVWDTKDLCE